MRPIIGFPAGLALLFIGLRFTGHIDWSWFWVLAPLWIPFGLWACWLGFIFGIIMLGAFLARD